MSLPANIEGAAIVGRAAEKAAIKDALDAAARGSGSVLVFEGEAGVGKSALLLELMSQARERGYEVFYGAARVQTSDLPFAPLVEAFDLHGAHDDDRAPIVRMLAAPDAAQALGAGLGFQIVEALAEFVEGRVQQGAVVIAIDDLQWADPSTLSVLERLVHLITSDAGLLACTARPDLPPEVALPVKTLGARGQRFHLEGLHTSEIEELVEARFGAPASKSLLEMLRRTAGNPFFIRELLGAAIEEGSLAIGDTVDIASGVPPSLALTMLGRFRDLPEETVRTLRVAGVLGSDFSVEELRAMTGSTGSELMLSLGPALSTELVVERSGRLHFRHDLVWEVLYEDTPASLRMALHADAAQSLEEAGAPPGVVASHVRASAAPGDEMAVLRLRRAAEAVLDRAPVVAADLLQHALSVVESSSTQRYELRVLLAQALAGAGRFEDAERVARKALAERRGGSQDRDLLVTLARSLFWAGRSHEMAGRLEEAAHEPEATSLQRAHLLVEAASGALEAGELERAEALAEEAAIDAEAADDDTARCRILLLQAALGKTGSLLTRAIATQRKAVELVRSGEVAEDTAVWALMLLGDNLGHRSEHRSEAVELLTAGARRAEEAGITWSAPTFHFIVGVIRYREGNWDDALVDLETSFRLGQETAGTMAAMGAALLALIHSRRGELSRAEHWIAAAESSAHMSTEQTEWTLARAFFAEAGGSPQEALEVLAESLKNAPAGITAMLGIDYGVHIARLAIALDSSAAVEMVLDATSEAARQEGHPYMEGIAEATRAIIERDSDGALAALEKIRSADAVASSTADVAQQAALLLVKDGRSREAVPFFEEALAIWEKAGAAHQVRWVEARLREVGVRRRTRRRRPSVGWEAVTPAEQAVLDLILEGLVYREIGDRLFISKRTVETHVMHLFQKLGAANRRSLEEAARQRLPE